VDTAPPVPSATLLSPSPSSLAAASVLVGCWDALTAANCSVTLVARVFPPGGLSPYDSEIIVVPPSDLDGNRSATVDVPFRLPNGAMEVIVAATDGAGNTVTPGRGRPAVTAVWTRDTHAPDTTSALAQSQQLVYVGGALNATVTNVSTVVLVVSASEPVAGYRVVVSEGTRANSSVVPATGTSSTLTVDLPWDGVMTVSVVGAASPSFAPTSQPVHSGPHTLPCPLLPFLRSVRRQLTPRETRT
jgi:hypothetical protein